MYNTAFGIGTAVLAVIVFAFLQAKTQQLEDDINEATVSVLNLVTENRDKFFKAGEKRTQD
jgi:biopolymer transport protein ExbB/TolQ